MPIDMDPAKERSWYALRIYWMHVRGNCARCGGPIHYDGLRYRFVWKGERRVRIENPFALDVGHKVEADLDKRKFYSPNDTQPEHARCNRKMGARYGNKKRGWGKTARRVTATYAVKTTRDW